MKFVDVIYKYVFLYMHFYLTFMIIYCCICMYWLVVAYQHKANHLTLLIYD